MIAAKAKEPGKAKAEAPGQKAKQQPASPQAPVFNPLWQRLALGVQAELAVSAPDDADEREAEEVAERVMRMPDSAVRVSPAVPSLRRKCVGCEREDEEKKSLQTKAESPLTSVRMGGGLSSASPAVHEVLCSPGQPLDPEVRAFMEPRFGYDFGRVRVHTDATAAESAKAVRAVAYTVGQDVVFGMGRYRPGPGEGRRLLAHELAHVVQQANADQPRISRVPEKGEIDEGYCFSSNCGWIDWSHADPSLSANLIQRVRQTSDALTAAGTNATPATGELTSPTMTSGIHSVGLVVHSASLQVKLLRPLSPDEVLSVSLSIFKKLSIVFETQQELTDLLRASSFSQEDLPSNLIGFYRAAKGYKKDDIKRFCGALDKAGSLQEYDRNHSFQKNRSFSPIGATGAWPKELSDINDTAAESLYEVLRISAIKGTTGYTFCPLYRIEGTIDETDLFLFSIGGTTFTTADNVRVVPTYRAYPGTSGQYGHVNFIEVSPYSPEDFAAFATKKTKWPIYVPAPVLVCLSSKSNPI